MKCPQCPKEYQSQKDLDRHMKKIHGLSIVKMREVSKEEKSEFIEKCVKLLDERNQR